MTSVRWTRAEAEQVAADTIAAWFIDKYHASYLANCLNTGTKPDAWTPHAGHRAQADANGERIARAVLDALGLTAATFTVTDGHLEQVGWVKDDGSVIDAGDSAEMQLVEMAPDRYVPVYRVVPS